MRKVAYILSIRDSLESFIYREILLLQKKGIEIIAFSLFKDRGGLYSPSEIIPVFTLKAFGILFAFVSEFLKSPNSYTKLFFHAASYRAVPEFLIGTYFARKIRQQSVDTLQCHFGDKKFFVAYYCKRLTGITLNLTVHAHEIFANPNEKLFKAIINEADNIICISEKNKTLLIEDFGVRAELIEVIRLSIDLENFSKSNEVYFLTVARYTERKGFRELFEAISLLPDFGNIKFITIGWGPLDLNSLAEEFNVTDKVIVFDKMSPEKLRFFYNKCQVFCLPSKATKEEGEEGIPVVLMEAMASSMLILTTNNGSICELVDEIVVEQGSVIALKEGIEAAYSLIQNGGFDGRVSRDKVETHYSVENVNRLHKHLYE